MKKKILFLGGSYAQIPIIREAGKRGWYIIICDYLNDNPGRNLADEYYNISTTDYHAVLELAKKNNPDFIVAYASDPAAPIASYVSEQLGKPGNPFQAVEVLSEKDLFRKFLTVNNFNCPRAVSINISDNINEKIAPLSFPIIVKPTDSSGSKGVSKVRELSQLSSAIKKANNFSRNKRLIAEEFIEGYGSQLHGDGFVVDGRLIFCYLGDHHYNVDINPFVPYSTTWPTVKDKDVVQKIEDELQRAIILSGFKNGPINIEVRVDSEQNVYIMEIGPRSGGNFVPQVINYATDFDMVSATLNILDGKEILVEGNKRGCAAYYVLHSQCEGTLQHLKISEKIKPYIKEFHQYLDCGDKVKSFQGANAAIGVLLLTFSSKEEMSHLIQNMSDYVSIKVLKK